MAAPVFAFPQAPLTKTLTLEEAREAIKEVTNAFNTPENLEKMNAARAQAGEDIMKMMQLVVPVAMSIQQNVIIKYGFTADQPGVMQFAMAIKAHEADPEIAALAAQLRQQFMPKLPSFNPPR